MKKVIAGAVAAIALASTALVAPTPALARASFGISINAGDVMFAYQDGYWDRSHRWHRWRHSNDWRWYRAHYRSNYYDWRHDRDPDRGWRVGVYGGPGHVPPPVQLSFSVGDVMFAYQDGYWDRGHRWHAWRDENESRWWRDHYHDRFYDWRHDRDADQGWRNTGGPNPMNNPQPDNRGRDDRHPNRDRGNDRNPGDNNGSNNGPNPGQGNGPNGQ